MGVMTIRKTVDRGTSPIRFLSSIEVQTDWSLPLDELAKEMPTPVSQTPTVSESSRIEPEKANPQMDFQWHHTSKSWNEPEKASVRRQTLRLSEPEKARVRSRSPKHSRTKPEKANHRGRMDSNLTGYRESLYRRRGQDGRGRSSSSSSAYSSRSRSNSRANFRETSSSGNRNAGPEKAQYFTDRREKLSKSHLCGNCDLTFTSNFYLVRHVKYQCPSVAREAFQCHFHGCGMSFRRPDLCRRHYKRWHGVVCQKILPTSASNEPAATDQPAAAITAKMAEKENSPPLTAKPTKAESKPLPASVVVGGPPEMARPAQLPRRKWKPKKGANFGDLDWEVPALPTGCKPEMADSGAEDADSNWDDSDHDFSLE
jgi:hypothetical protein